MRKINKKSDLSKLISLSIAGIILSLFVYFKYNLLIAFITLVVFIVAVNLFYYFRLKLRESARIKKIEEVFPDFIELMASNLRAGMTVDQAFLLSSRKEFSPLDEEILILGKDIVTGRDISLALVDLGKRIKSEKINKTISLITSGIRSGGNLSILLEETAASMRERIFVEKKASSNVLMYSIFIFFAASVGAPILFALSSVLVQIMSQILGNIPQAANDFSSKLPFTLSKINISSTFVTFYAIAFLMITNLLASLVLGITNKGEEKAGLNYTLPMIIIGILVFLLIRLVMIGYFSQILG